MADNDGNVREMTRTEKNFFNGVTIDADSTEGDATKENFRTYDKNYGGYRTRTTYVNVGGSNIFTNLFGKFLRAVLNGNRLAQVAAFLIGLAFAALMFFVALPIMFVILAIGLALLFMAKISR